MKRNYTNIKVKAITGVFVATLVFSQFNMITQAASLSSVLPSAGIGLALVENSKTSKNVNITVIQDASVAKASKSTEEAMLDDMVGDAEDFSKLVIAQVHDYVNVRSLPSEEGEILGKLYNNSVGTFVKEENGWYQITSGSVTGYVKAEYCVTGTDAVELAKTVGTRIATVTTTTLKVRSEASLDATVLGLIPLEEELTVTEEVEGWVKVNIEEGDGYVSSDYVSLRTEFVQAESKEEEAARLQKEEEARKAAQAAARKTSKSSTTTTNSNYTAPVVTGDSEQGKAVAEFALQFVGNPYVYGGTSLTDGADCSGFVLSVYKEFGVSLPHSSASDRSQGYAVASLDEAQPGDLICYSGHVALYIGGGQIVHASTSKTGIIVSKADYRKILAIRRIF